MFLSVAGVYSIIFILGEILSKKTPSFFSSAIWGHADYLSLYNNDKDKMKNFFDKRKIKKFKKIIFVSKEGKESFIAVYPKLKDRVITCNNLVNDKRILNQAEEPVKDLKKENVVTFLNVGRHDERQI